MSELGDLHEKVNKIAVDVAVTKTKVSGIEDKLVGNGEEGLMKRVTNLEKNEVRRLGFSAGVTTAIVALGKWLKII